MGLLQQARKSSRISTPKEGLMQMAAKSKIKKHK
jgi:hypothetical protein